MTAYGWTAGRFFKWDDPEHPGWVDLIMQRELTFVTENITGGCRGGDEIAGRLGVIRFPMAMHTIVLPSDRSQVTEWWLDYPEVPFNIIEVPGDYRQRNLVIVKLADRMNALVDKPEKSAPRSGTWMTIRIARDEGVPCRVHQWREAS